MLVGFLPLGLGALTELDDPWEVARTSIAIALVCLVVVVADTAQVMRRCVRKGSDLTEGRHVGIPVEATISCSKTERKVDVFTPESKEPFISFLTLRSTRSTRLPAV